MWSMQHAVVTLFLSMVTSIGSSAAIFSTADLFQIQSCLPAYDLRSIQDLLVERVGSSQGYMKTVGFHHSLSNENVYELSKSGLLPRSPEGREYEILDVSHILMQAQATADPPKRAFFVAEWMQWEASFSASSEAASNILGENGQLRILMDQNELEIPVETATTEKLAYYGAAAFQLGDVLRFPVEEIEYPIWVMRIGLRYVEDYLVTGKGGGWYLEWHTDRPHFHMPLSPEAGGIYLLAKQREDSQYEITAFRIPYGVGVFTGRGVIHCDAGLVGEDWIVGYSTARDFSTVLLRNQKGEMVQIKTIEE